MIDIPPPDTHSGDQYPFLEEILREAIPEIKLALGDLIDRENARAVPGRYARLLPEGLLVVTLRPDAAEALSPMAAEIETELTDSCMRHGSLYDRTYRVQLRRAEDPAAPLYRVGAHAGHDLAEKPAPTGGNESRPAAPGSGISPAAGGAKEPAMESTIAAPPASPPPSTTDRVEATMAAPMLPAMDPDATRIDGFGPPGTAPWEPGRWILLVESEEGEEREAFRLTERLVTIGRRSDDPLLQTTIALRDVPQVSRRQLALVWEPRESAPGFRVFNLGLPPLLLAEREIPGAKVGREAIRLDDVGEEHTGWLPPGVSLRIGDKGPQLRVEEVPELAEEDDPDRTVYE